MKILGLNVLFLVSSFFAFAQRTRIQSLQVVPLGRSQHGICYDSKKGEMLVFGGSKHYRNKIDSSEKVDNKLWALDGRKWKLLSETGPTWREDAKMVFHEQNNKTYLLGGRNYEAYGKANILDEFWEWEGMTWHLISSSIPMGKRLHTNMVYDSKRNRIVLFGGVDIERGFTNDIWEWDGKVWTKINTLNSIAPRIAHSMTYSPLLNKTIIAGGVSEKDEKLTDMWTWDGNQFEKLSNEIPAIEPGSGNIVSIGKSILLFGRIARNEQKEKIGSTWIFDGSSWQKITTKIAPSIRENHSMVYDSMRKRALLFGGNGREESNFENPNDLWEWSGNEWKKLK